MHNDPVIKFEETEIPVVDQYKFLGVTFDKKINIHPSHKIFEKQIPESPKLLRMDVDREWGEQQTLLKLYRSLIRSQLDYTSFI